MSNVMKEVAEPPYSKSDSKIMEDQSHALGTVLVVGGCGYLGSSLVRQLLDSKDATSIAVIDIKTSNGRHQNVTYHELDICSQAQVASTLNQIHPDVIFHTASPAAFGFDLKFYEKVNVGGTKCLLRAAESTGSTKAFVFTSSASVIHDGTSDLINADDATPVVLLPVQKSLYSHSKAMAEQLVLEANHKAGKMLTCSMRLSAMFGEEDPTTTKPMVDAAAAGKYRYQMGDGTNLFDRTYVGNVVQGHVRAAHALISAYHSPSLSAVPADQRVDGEAFLITNDEPVSFWEFARALGAAAGYPTQAEKVKVIPRWLGLVIVTLMEWALLVSSMGKQDSSPITAGIRYSMINRTYSVEKAKKRLNYKPSVDMTEAIKRAGGSFLKKEKKED